MSDPRSITMRVRPDDLEIIEDALSYLLRR
jgi:flagellar biosynthesis/type III secretory pathway protein FliH